MVSDIPAGDGKNENLFLQCRGLEIVVEAAKVLLETLLVRDSLPEPMQNDGITVLNFLEKSRADPDPDQKFLSNPTDFRTGSGSVTKS